MEIKVGQIWEVMKKGFMGNGREHQECEHCGRSGIIDIETEIEIGIRIEIRYPYEWHYRTEDNKWYQSKSKEILEKCKFVGTINEDVWWNNKVDLKEILEKKLYKT